MGSITTTEFNIIIANEGDSYTHITEGATTYDAVYGSIATQTTSDASVTIYVEPIDDSEPLVLQGKIKSGSKRAFAKPTDDINDGDLLKDSDDVKWKVTEKQPWKSGTTKIYDEFIMVRNE